MVGASELDRVVQGADDRLLTDDVTKLLGPIFAR
jgi:hypothetical protein